MKIPTFQGQKKTEKGVNYRTANGNCLPLIYEEITPGVVRDYIVVDLFNKEAAIKRSSFETLYVVLSDYKAGTKFMKEHIRFLKNDKDNLENLKKAKFKIFDNYDNFCLSFYINPERYIGGM